MTDEPTPSGELEPTGSGALEVAKQSPVKRDQLPVRQQPTTRPDDPVGVPIRVERRSGRVGPRPRRPDWMLAQLPVGMVQSDFFVRFVSIFQELGTSLLEDADLVEHLPDGTVTPVPMVGRLAAWIGVDSIDASMSEDKQRTVLASSSRTLSRRGTPGGLRNYLEMLSGGPARVSDGGGVWAADEAPGDVAWVRMSVAGTGHLSEDEFIALVRDEVPAHVRAELWVDGRRVLSTVEEEW